MKPLSLGVLQSLFIGRSAMTADRFELLFENNVKLVRSVIYQMAGDQHLDDLTQEVFIKIWNNFDKFKNESDFKSWVYRITVNTTLDYLKSKKRKSEDLTESFDSFSDKTNTDENIANKDLVHKAILNLSDDHRAVAVLALLHGFSITEISSILSIPEGTVKSRLHYGKEQLKEQLQKLFVNTKKESL